MEQDITKLEELLPHLVAAQTCRDFCAVVIARVPKQQKHALALTARDALDMPWSDTMVRQWLAPGCHTEAFAAKKTKARRRNYERKTATPEGKEKVRKTGRANAAKTRSTPEGRSAANATYRKCMVKRIASGKWAEYQRKRRSEDPAFSLRLTLSGRVNKAIRAARSDARKASRTMDLVGCTPEFLVAHIESQFPPGMSWENRAEWHVDHVRPLASWSDLSDPAQQREAFHYSNLQPLWAEENMAKGSLYDGVRHRFR